MWMPPPEMPKASPSTAADFEAAARDLGIYFKDASLQPNE
jgi:hypothetical protein